jgi:hypothetical protein
MTKATTGVRILKVDFFYLLLSQLMLLRLLRPHLCCLSKNTL